jgi:hypothetical protein
LGGKLLFIKVTFWIGIIGDLLTCIPLLFPDIAKKMYGLENIIASNEYLYVARIAASLMLGWTFLLFWAVLKPLERKGILLLTVFPVMCGLVGAGILAVTSGLVPGLHMLPVWVFNSIIIIIFSLAYYFASVLARKPA